MGLAQNAVQFCWCRWRALGLLKRWCWQPETFLCRLTRMNCCGTSHLIAVGDFPGGERACPTTDLARGPPYLVFLGLRGFCGCMRFSFLWSNENKTCRPLLTRLWGLFWNPGLWSVLFWRFLEECLALKRPLCNLMFANADDGKKKLLMPILSDSR